MSEKLMKQQSSDSANASGFGTKQLSPNQGSPLIAASIQDGGQSGKGTKMPPKDTGTR